MPRRRPACSGGSPRRGRSSASSPSTAPSATRCSRRRTCRSLAAAVVAVVPALLVERLAVRPLWNLLFRFQAAAQRAAGELIFSEATAVTPFRNGRGIVSVVREGRLVQLAARLGDGEAVAARQGRRAAARRGRGRRAGARHRLGAPGRGVSSRHHRPRESFTVTRSLDHRRGSSSSPCCCLTSIIITTFLRSVDAGEILLASRGRNLRHLPRPLQGADRPGHHPGRGSSRRRPSTSTSRSPTRRPTSTPTGARRRSR